MSRHGMSTEQASKVKLKGHQREKEFNNKYGSSDDELNYSGASADCEIRQGHKILETLQKVIGTNSREVSLKGGNTMQIHLGNLPELTDKNNYTVSKKIVKNKKATCVDHGIPFSQQVKNLQQKAFWNKKAIFWLILTIMEVTFFLIWTMLMISLSKSVSGGIWKQVV